MTQPGEETAEAPVACTLTVVDLARQSKRWKKLGAQAGIARAETADGLRLAFRDHATVEGELRALVAVEDECCSWAQWEVSREDGALVVSVRSSGSGVATLHAMFREEGD